jgi:hypothetical protein
MASICADLWVSGGATIGDHALAGTTCGGEYVQLIENAQVCQGGVATEIEEIVAQATSAGSLNLAIVKCGEILCPRFGAPLEHCSRLEQEAQPLAGNRATSPSWARIVV